MPASMCIHIRYVAFGVTGASYAQPDAPEARRHRWTMPVKVVVVVEDDPDAWKPPALRVRGRSLARLRVMGRGWTRGSPVGVGRRRAARWALAGVAAEALAGV